MNIANMNHAAYLIAVAQKIAADLTASIAAANPEEISKNVVYVPLILQDLSHAVGKATEAERAEAIAVKNQLVALVEEAGKLAAAHVQGEAQAAQPSPTAAFASFSFGGNKTVGQA